MAAAADVLQTRTYSQGALIWLRFRHHRAAMVSLAILGVFLVLSVFAEFFIPNSPFEQYKGFNYAPPRPLHFIDAQGGLHVIPFMYGYTQTLNRETFQREWIEDETEVYPLRFFVQGYEYRLLGIFPTSIHLFGVENGAPPLFLFGSDNLGRDVFSRTIYASRVSLSIALFGVLITIGVGVTIGGMSGYFGGIFDDIVQRISELLLAIPKIPLWLALAAAVPQNQPIMTTYLIIVVIASLTSWPFVARGVRSKLISLRNEDYVLAAISYGSSSMRIIFRYLVPNFMSYIIVSISLGIPGIILMETSLSFLGIGLQSPAISWGVLLEQAQNFQDVIIHPWLLFPGAFVVVAIMAFNFVGDGLRDAADPYEKLK